MIEFKMKIIIVLLVLFLATVFEVLAEESESAGYSAPSGFGEDEQEPQDVTGYSLPAGFGEGEQEQQESTGYSVPSGFGEGEQEQQQSTGYSAPSGFGEDEQEQEESTGYSVPSGFGDEQPAGFGSKSVGDKLSRAGEPSITYFVPSGYSPATAGPLTIKKTVKPVESGKGHANRLKVEVEITSARKDRNDDAINDIDIYELVDESLNLVPPDDDINNIKKINNIEQLADIFLCGSYESISEIPLMNSLKASSLDEIGLMRLALLSDQPLSAEDPKSYRKVYANMESKTQVNLYSPLNTSDYVFYLNNTDGIDFNDSSNLNDISDYFKDSFGLGWINSSNIDIFYPGESKIQMKNIKIADNDLSDNWILFIIDDLNKTDGRVIMNISDKMIYYLNYETNITDDSHWDIFDQNEIMRFNLKNMDSKDRLFYWYYVRPKKSGPFITESIIRIRDEDYRGWPDIIYPLSIEVGKPDYRFEVDPILEGSKVFVHSDWIPDSWEGFNVSYIIRYTGESSNTYLKNLKIEINPGEGYLAEEDKHLEKINFTREKNNIITLNRRIGYNNTGTFRIPALWIEGTPYIFKETVTVDEPILRYWGIFNSYYTIIAALLLILVNKEVKGIFGWVRNLFLLAARKLGLRKRAPRSQDDKVDLKLSPDEIEPKIEGRKTKTDRDATEKEEAAKKMANLIIEALERGGRDRT
ncbi:MAG: hypothetical protein KBA97_02420 [Methanothrix sp.]|nr:hypothetical protein [Methanothrix sp.]